MRGAVRLRTLVVIRWVALAGQAATILLVHVGLGFRLPIEIALTIVGLSVLVNLAAGLGRPARARLSDAAAVGFLGYDLLQLTALLYLTGGLQNPFAILILAPVAVSATILSRRSTIGLCVLAAACLSALAVWHLPLPWSGPPLELPRVYVVAIWSALMIATGFIGAYAWQVAEEARRLADALAATQMVLAREHQLSALGGLAAAAAHELGSPLSTIAVVAKELARDVAPDSPLADDVKLLLSQSERCREILTSLTHRPQTGGGAPFEEMPLSLLVEVAAEPHERDGVELHIRCLTPSGEDADEVDWPEPAVQRRP
ncbi:MAG: ActS/PrrB/RegB family redox-sensitive histidine kinase, partial [Alphaproteobacteria bacterium]|nr:ActS/PrrB/RegB family redox-sensitive histidine kinase [Alphaproteobacteria bacterium]